MLVLCAVYCADRRLSASAFSIPGKLMVTDDREPTSTVRTFLGQSLSETAKVYSGLPIVCRQGLL
eukprot:m.55965 g.55965  ORF g.55965 m.55965 type:complete len:65 (+) comp34527_c0_seq2:396-590(+)